MNKVVNNNSESFANDKYNQMYDIKTLMGGGGVLQ